MEDQREQINPDDLTFVDMDNDAEQPVKVGSFSGFKPDQKLMYLTELGGQPWMRIVTVEREAILGGGIGLVIFVKECGGYLDSQKLCSLETIQDMFDDYTEKDARRWRAIDDGIIPAAQLSNEEIDKIIDENEEWCKKYEEMQKELDIRWVKIDNHKLTGEVWACSNCGIQMGGELPEICPGCNYSIREEQQKWSREDAEARALDQIPEDQTHTDEDEDDDEYDDLGGPSHVMGSSPTCQP